MTVRRVTTAIVLAAFVAFATGLTLAIHLHEAGDGHHAQTCSFCQVAVTGAVAPLGGPAPFVADAGVDHGLPPTIETDASTDHCFNPIAPRAPPAC